MFDRETKEIKQKNLCANDFKGFIRKIEGLVEVIIFVFIYYFIWKMAYRGEEFPNYYGNGKYLLALVYAFLVFVFFYLCDSFKYGHRKMTEVIISQWISMVLVNIITYFQLCLIANRMVSPFPVIVLLAIDLFIAALCTYIFTSIYHHVYVPKNMVMIYGNEKAVDLKFKMDTRPDKYCVTKVLSCEEGYETIRNEIAGHDAVIINDVPAQIRNDILKYCYAKGVRTYVVPKVSDIIVGGADEINLFDTPLLLVKGRGISPAQKALKRVGDIILCLIALIPGLPIMAVVAACIRHEDHGPVFYKQKRVTEGGRVFEILKFRSMVVDADKIEGAVLATEDDPRITKTGRVIRAIRFDELPQILNILKGDMSWVGPRPEQVGYTEEFIKEMPEYAFRTKVIGGLTGYAQIYEKYNSSPYDKARLDLMYIENYSLFLDIKLLFMTVQILLKKESTEGIDKADELREKREKLLNDENNKKKCIAARETEEFKKSLNIPD
ncbi:MAG: exopolysaccharide biosynthesis polyprenyl glycosylphosphotransferase [Lachnospiraceae bacterium]|nr:exopolysaccharide biosynthesis polyprenyl glycosylphosphotransferase [Lachnospiraceae bacterium]